MVLLEEALPMVECFYNHNDSSFSDREFLVAAYKGLWYFEYPVLEYFKEREQQ